MPLEDVDIRKYYQYYLEELGFQGHRNQIIIMPFGEIEDSLLELAWNCKGAQSNGSEEE